MPTYSYACTSCSHAFDIRQSFTDDTLTFCPECGEHTLRKVIHPVGIAFKGSGFYKTDSRASASKASGSGDKGSGSGSDKGAEKGSGSGGDPSSGSGSSGSSSGGSGSSSTSS